MARKKYLLSLGIPLFLFGQTPDYDTTGRYAVNYRTENIPGFYETMSNSRIYYPDSSGQVPGSSVPCPIIVFGHGFMMGIDRYYSYARHLASWGYVVVLPVISNPFPTPEHYTRARSMVDAARWTALRSDSAGDRFYQKLDKWNWGFTGHSMGGGLAMLAADTFKLRDTLRAAVGLACPQTTPETHSQHLLQPKMIIAGSVDNIAVWNDVRSAHWASAPAPGVFAVIHGANHGYFMDNSQSWENGGTATITRAEQLRIARRHLTAYFERYLQGDSSAWNFQYCYGDSIWHHPTMDTVEVRLEGVGASDRPGAGDPAPVMWVQPNPNRGRFMIFFEVRVAGPVVIDIYDASGRWIARVYDGCPTPGLKTVNGRTADLPAGVYLAQRRDAAGTSIRSMVLEP